ncbi:MAG TPA: lysylphosphatidylglycerol synthase transmembrane domain-containing protein [Solirubrobacteraceae bacterium]|nr:lysylphosphatidylglycerol synthase transmembrane domain-containing protein [Solirubrobacteraceae bacterium]
MGRAGWKPFITLVVVAASIGALLLVAPPAKLVAQLGALRLDWVLIAIALEIGSCLSYVIVFRRLFPEPPRGTAWRVAWVSMGAGAVLPGGNMASAVSTGLLLRKHGIGTLKLAERCAALLCFLTALGFVVNGGAAVLILLGVDSRHYNLLHSLGPLAVSVVVLGGAVLLARSIRRLGPRAPRALRGVAAALEGGWRLVREAHWRLLGAAGFTLLDMAALWAACRATGHPLGAPALIVAYCIGYLATLIPMPAGIGVLDSGLSGSLVLYGVAGPAAVSATLVYHAVSIWVPALGGLIAWLPTRSLRAQPLPQFAATDLAADGLG